MRVPPGLVEQVHAAFCRHRPLGLDANFFEAGFSSSMLVQVREALGALDPDLSLIDLYRYPTVRSLAAELARRRDGTDTAAGAPEPPPWATSAGLPPAGPG